MRLISLNFILLTVIAVVIASRPRRDISLIKDLVYSTLFGSNKDIQANTALKGAQLYRIPGDNNILLKAVPKSPTTKQVMVTFPRSVDINFEAIYPNLALIASYLGTKSEKETLEALRRIQCLLQSGILQDNSHSEFAPSPSSVQSKPIAEETLHQHEDGVSNWFQQENVETATGGHKYCNEFEDIRHFYDQREHNEPKDSYNNERRENVTVNESELLPDKFKDVDLGLEVTSVTPSKIRYLDVPNPYSNRNRKEHPDSKQKTVSGIKTHSNNQTRKFDNVPFPTSTDINIENRKTDAELKIPGTTLPPDTNNTLNRVNSLKLQVAEIYKKLNEKPRKDNAKMFSNVPSTKENNNYSDIDSLKTSSVTKGITSVNKIPVNIRVESAHNGNIENKQNIDNNKNSEK